MDAIQNELSSFQAEGKPMSKVAVSAVALFLPEQSKKKKAKTKQMFKRIRYGIRHL